MTRGFVDWFLGYVFAIERGDAGWVTRSDWVEAQPNAYIARTLLPAVFFGGVAAVLDRQDQWLLWLGAILPMMVFALALGVIVRAIYHSFYD